MQAVFKASDAVKFTLIGDYYTIHDTTALGYNIAKGTVGSTGVLTTARRQDTQVGAEQDRGIGGRRQVARGRTSLQEQSVVGRQPNIETRLPSCTISSISSTTITNRVR